MALCDRRLSREGLRHGAAEQHQLPDREALPREVPWRASSVRQRGRSLRAIALHTMARGAIDVPRVLADLAFAVPLLSALLDVARSQWLKRLPAPDLYGGEHFGRSLEPLAAQPIRRQLAIQFSLQILPAGNRLQQRKRPMVAGLEFSESERGAVCDADLDRPFGACLYEVDPLLRLRLFRSLSQRIDQLSVFARREAIREVPPATYQAQNFRSLLSGGGIRFIGIGFWGHRSRTSYVSPGRFTAAPGRLVWFRDSIVRLLGPYNRGPLDRKSTRLNSSHANIS